MLGWTHGQLAMAAGCRYDTVKYVEAGSGRPRPSTVAAIRAALEDAGVVFADESDNGLGVRLRQDPPQGLRAP